MRAKALGMGMHIPWAFAASTLCALCAFGLKYQPEHRRLRGPGDVDPED